MIWPILKKIMDLLEILKLVFSKLFQGVKVLQKPFRFLIITVLIIGIFFRFVNLDKKVFWFDEVATVYKIFGYTGYQDSFNGEIVTISELYEYQRPDPEKSVVDVVKNLAISDPKHVPLYFVIARFWAEWFGSSATALRSLSVLISLLMFPCLYWVCLELFQSPLVGWVAVALIAVSPFNVLYAQESRMYSLQAVMFLLSSAILLRGVRDNTKLTWGLYAVSLSLSLYTQTLSILVGIAQGIYVIAIEGIRWSKVVKSYLAAASLGLLSFLPWLVVILNNFEQVSKTIEWQTKTIPLSSLVAFWGINLSRIFLDFDPTHSHSTDFSSFKNPWSIFLIGTLLILIGYSIYFLIRHSPRRVWLLICALLGFSALPLAIPDLIFGGIRSFNSRYLIAFYLSIHLSVAYLLATKVTLKSTKLLSHRFWKITLVSLISSGVLSCMFISQADTWWNKYFGADTIQISRIINQTESPLLIVSDHWGSQMSLWSMSKYLDHKVRLQLVAEKSANPTPVGFSDVFLFSPSKRFLDKIEKEHKVKVESVLEGTSSVVSLWKLR